MIDEKRSFQSLKSNAQGHFFEKEIERACNYYREKYCEYTQSSRTL